MPEQLKLHRIPLTTEDSLNREDLDHELSGNVSPNSVDNGGVINHNYSHGLDSKESALEHPCHELKKILGSGTFYYSANFDLTNRLQNRYYITIFYSARERILKDGYLGQ